MVTKESEVSSASPPLYWSYVFVCDTVRRWNLPDLLSKLAPPSIVSASIASDDLTARVMHFLNDSGIISCSHHFFCFRKPDDDHTR